MIATNASPTIQSAVTAPILQTNQDPNISYPSHHSPSHQQQLQQPIRVESFNSFLVNEVKSFDVYVASHFKSANFNVRITSSLLGDIEKYVEWPKPIIQNTRQQYNKCKISFTAPIVDLYTITIEVEDEQILNAQFQAKAYDLAKVLIKKSSSKCFVDESYEFQVDASEAGQGQLEIAVNDGEIPNQVEVLDNGRCLVKFSPEEAVTHVVDIKFNGHNVIGCPFYVEVSTKKIEHLESTTNENNNSLVNSEKALLVREEHILVNTQSEIRIENISPTNINDDILILDPDRVALPYEIVKHINQISFVFTPRVFGDCTVELKPGASNKLPAHITIQFPLILQVFDHYKVVVSDVSNGVVNNPVYFFIDASQAGSGNLEIRVSSKNRNVLNQPQAEANAKIRVSFIPDEAIDHVIDVKFNGLAVLNSPFVVKVADKPQAVIKEQTLNALKYIEIDKLTYFQIDYIGTKENGNLSYPDLKPSDFKGFILSPNFEYKQIISVTVLGTNSFKVGIKPDRVGPNKLFLYVKNELVPASPLICNVYSINEILVTFDQNSLTSRNNLSQEKLIAHINKPFNFSVDASRAGEGTLALLVFNKETGNPLQTRIKVLDSGQGLYNLTLVPEEKAVHSIDMSFNDKTVPGSPFIIDIANEEEIIESQPKVSNETNKNDSPPVVQEKVHEKDEVLSQNDDQTPTKLLKDHNKAIESKKSLAHGLVNATNVIYLETGVLDKDTYKVQIIGPNGEEIPFKISREGSFKSDQKKPYIEYKPKLTGAHTINLYEDGSIFKRYHVEICDPTRASLINFNSNHNFVVGNPVVLVVDCKESGMIQFDNVTICRAKYNGEHTLLSRIKSISSPHTSQSSKPLEYLASRVSETKTEIRFIPPTPDKYMVDIRCLGQPIKGSPFTIHVESPPIPKQNVTNSSSKEYSSKTMKQKNDNDSFVDLTANQALEQKQKYSENEILKNIVVSGKSLKAVQVNTTGSFVIKTNRMAHAQEFDVYITDPKNSFVDVKCYLREDGDLIAEWVPRRIGLHKIEVLFRQTHQISGSPFTSEVFEPKMTENKLDEDLKDLKISKDEVKVHKETHSCDADKVICTGDGLKGGIMGEEIKTFIDTRKAGPGELTALCNGPHRVAFCELLDRGDGTFILFIKPQESGKHLLTVKYGGVHIPRSPFTIKVSGKPDPSKVKVFGPGVEHGVLSLYQSKFVCDTRGAGAGQLTVRIRGPKGAFRMETQREGQRERTILCKYDPTEPGDYRIEIKWSGRHVQGSPFTVMIFDTQEELSRYLAMESRYMSTKNAYHGKEIN